MARPPFLFASALELAGLIRAQVTSSREVVEAHLAWLDAMNPRLNAVVSTRHEEARAEADAADRRLREEGPEALPPLHGVPCTIKESFALQGMPNTAGLVRRVGQLATADAESVRRLRAAGAIPLGVTNTSELCMWFESSNRVYGRTNNAYDPGRIAGGSSGGEGAAVGAGLSPFGLGADIGGSIRMPAFFNGVFGLKPSAGRVPNAGQFPISENAALRYLCSGPLARRASDLMPLLRLLATPVEDPALPALGDPAAVRLDTLRVLDVPDDGAAEVSEQLAAAQARVARHLAARGARVRRERVPGLRAAIEIWVAGMSLAADTSFRSLLGYQGPGPVWSELCKWLARRSRHTFPALVLAAFEKAPLWSEARMRRVLARGLSARDALEEELGEQGVMLFPSFPTPAPRHHAPLFTPTDFAYTAIVNVFEMPAVQVPLGLTPQGVPLGVQVVARRGREHVAVAVALELERAFGGWVPPRPLLEWSARHG